MDIVKAAGSESLLNNNQAKRQQSPDNKKKAEEANSRSRQDDSAVVERQSKAIEPPKSENGDSVKIDIVRKELTSKFGAEEVSSSRKNLKELQKLETRKAGAFKEKDTAIRREEVDVKPRIDIDNKPNQKIENQGRQEKPSAKVEADTVNQGPEKEDNKKSESNADNKSKAKVADFRASTKEQPAKEVDSKKDVKVSEGDNKDSKIAKSQSEQSEKVGFKPELKETEPEIINAKARQAKEQDASQASEGSVKELKLKNDNSEQSNSGQPDSEKPNAAVKPEQKAARNSEPKTLNKKEEEQEDRPEFSDDKTAEPSFAAVDSKSNNFEFSVADSPENSAAPGQQPAEVVSSNVGLNLAVNKKPNIASASKPAATQANTPVRENVSSNSQNVKVAVAQPLTQPSTNTSVAGSASPIAEAFTPVTSAANNVIKAADRALSAGPANSQVARDPAALAAERAATEAPADRITDYEGARRLAESVRDQVLANPGAAVQAAVGGRDVSKLIAVLQGLS